MTKEEIIEGNKLIASFMNLENVFEYKTKKEVLGLYIAEDDTGYIDYVDVGINWVNYNCSYDWLIPVVDKIENIGFTVKIEKTSCLIREFTKGYSIEAIYPSKLEAVYNSVVKFIKWYNNEKLK